MKNKGISLITLVITIIIMIILAGAIILTLTQSGIFDKANDAVSEYSLKQVQAIADLAWSEAYADGVRDKATLQDAVDKALEDNNLEDKYKAVATEKGVTVTEKVQGGNTAVVPEEWQEYVSEVTSDNVPIPVGFVASPYDGTDGLPAENTKAGGLVIYALTTDEIAAGVTDIVAADKAEFTELKDIHYNSMETRNQFVWVPVDDFKNDFLRTAFIGDTLSQTLGSDCWELVLDENNIPSQDTTNDNIDTYVSATTLAEATEMYNSVAKYGGFYIARYEVGKDDSGNTSITMGKYPYNNVAWGEGMIETADDNGAVSQSRSFYPSTGITYGVVSTLTYGVQWDTTLNWWKQLNPSLDLTDSTNYGNYYNTTITIDDYNEGAQYSTNRGSSWASAVAKAEENSYLLTTGAFKNANVNNIYDMAGNLWEWTMEGASMEYLSSDDRVNRGGGFLRR